MCTFLVFGEATVLVRIRRVENLRRWKLLARQPAVGVLVELREAVERGLGFGLSHRGAEDTEEQRHDGVVEFWSHGFEVEVGYLVLVSKI